MKLKDVPEMKYFSTDKILNQSIPRGEICFKGTNVT